MMSLPPQEPDQILHEETRQNPTRFVEELANEHDYWLSLTDAARITRTSEPMVRRWVTAGRLPVRKEPAGINQRTRLVRASDVAQIRPIIDPTAAITDDIHKIDLLSIPRQQQQIIRDQQHLSERIQGMQQQIDAQITHIQTALEQHVIELHHLSQEWQLHFTSQQTKLQEILDNHQQRYKELNIQIEHVKQESEQLATVLQTTDMQQRQALASITEQITKERSSTHKALQEAQQYLERLDRDIHLQTEQLSHNFSTRLQQQEEQFLHLLGGLKETLATHDQAQQQLQEALLTTRHNYQIQQEMLQTRIEKIVDDQKQQWSSFSHEQSAQHEYMKTMEQRVATIETTRDSWLASQEQIADQGKKLQWLTMLLQDERSARQVLSEQSARQQEQLLALSQELERFKNGQNGK